MSDGRRDKRIEASMPVKIRWPGRGADEVVNVSPKGIQVHTSEPLNAPTLVSMEIVHPLCAVNVLGHVRWATSDAMGIEFDERDERVAALLKGTGAEASAEELEGAEKVA